MCAQAGSKGGGGGLEPDPAAELFTDERGWPSNAVVIRGLLARTAQDGIWRLHRSGDRQEYVEFLQEDVLGTRRLEEGRGTEVSLHREAEIVHFRARRSRASDVVWGGCIQALHCPGAAGISARPGTFRRQLPPLDPNSMGPACHYETCVWGDEAGNVGVGVCIHCPPALPIVLAG